MKTRRGVIRAASSVTTTTTATAPVKKTKLKSSKLAADSMIRGMKLLDLGPLIQGTVLKRPSATIRSPYVADVLLPDSTTVLAHAPALDVGGLCSVGSKVLLKPRPPGGKTSHSIELVYCLGPETGNGKCLVGAHPRLGEQLSKIVLGEGLKKKRIFRYVTQQSYKSIITFWNVVEQNQN